MSALSGTLLLGLALGLALGLLGQWALRASARPLEPAVDGHSPAGRYLEQRRRTLRTGGWTCLVAAAVLSGAGIITYLTGGRVG